MLARSIAGISMNMGSEGITYQNVATICEAIRSLSPVSRHNQITAMIEMSGSDATSAPKAGLRLAISDTAAARMPDSAALIVR